MKNLLFLFFLFLTGNCVMAQEPDNKIRWDSVPLAWEDFLGTPSNESTYHASTNSGLSYSYSLKAVGDEIHFKFVVESFFYPELSWVKLEGINADLLGHEQLHFDITELHARKLRKVLTAFTPRMNNEVKRELESVYQKIERSRRQMQQQYDKETRHGTLQEVQERWERKIENELKELESYSS